MARAAEQTEPTDADLGIRPEDDEEKRELRRQLFKAQRGSNAPASASKAATEETELRKAEIDMGKEIARRHNEAVSAPFKLVPKAS